MEKTLFRISFKTKTIFETKNFHHLEEFLQYKKIIALPEIKTFHGQKILFFRLKN